MSFVFWGDFFDGIFHGPVLIFSISLNRVIVYLFFYFIIDSWSLSLSSPSKLDISEFEFGSKMNCSSQVHLVLTSFSMLKSYLLICLLGKKQQSQITKKAIKGKESQTNFSSFKHNIRNLFLKIKFTSFLCKKYKLYKFQKCGPKYYLHVCSCQTATSIFMNKINGKVFALWAYLLRTPKSYSSSVMNAKNYI